MQKRAINSKYNQFIGKNKGGKNTKIYAIVDCLGNPVSFLLSGSQVHDSKVTILLLETTNIADNHVIADHAYRANKMRTYINKLSSCLFRSSYSL